MKYNPYNPFNPIAVMGTISLFALGTIVVSTYAAFFYAVIVLLISGIFPIMFDAIIDRLSLWTLLRTEYRVVEKMIDSVREDTEPLYVGYVVQSRVRFPAGWGVWRTRQRDQDSKERSMACCEGLIKEVQTEIGRLRLKVTSKQSRTIKFYRDGQGHY